MRNRVLILPAALLLATAATAGAQEPARPEPQPAPAYQASEPAPTPLAWGAVDFGYRGTSTSGDGARYSRYSDLSDGAFTRVVLGHATDHYLFDATAYNIGYRDQQYDAGYSNGRVTLFGGFNSIPLNYTDLATSPWNMTSENVFVLDPVIRQAVQNKTAGIVGVPQTAAQLATPSAYRAIAQHVDLSSLRQTADVGFNFDVNRSTAFNVTYTSMLRDGRQPWGASFAFNNANELPIAVDNRTNDVDANLEWTSDRGMFKTGYNGSFFSNNVPPLVWDNPLRATNTVPYDPSGYTNGNGPAQGQMSMAPDNMLNAFGATGMYKLGLRSTLTGSLWYTRMSQNDALIPWTTNSAIANSTVYKSFPELAALPRSTAQARVDVVNGILNFNTRPSRYVTLSARYRYNDRIDKTPEFDAIEYVRFDAVPEETGGITEPFDIRENSLDLSAVFTPIRYTSFKISYLYDDFARTSRAFANLTDNGFRASVDTVGNQYVTLRGMYEYSQRRGSGFNEAVITDAGGQPDLRMFDDAERNHSRGTLMLIVTPVEMVDFNVSFGAGKDDYQIGAMEFGLQNYKTTAFTAGVDLNVPGGIVLGAEYGHDIYTANQQSRNANPGPDPTWTDPNRNWTLKNEEKTNTVTLFADVPKIARNANVHVAYEFSDSNNGFNFGGPRIASLAAIGQFIPLPAVTNSWHRVTTDVQYFVTKAVGVGVSYWYEKLAVVDFATINLAGTQTPRIDYLGEISTGYGNRPYTGNTAFARVFYRF